MNKTQRSKVLLFLMLLLLAAFFLVIRLHRSESDSPAKKNLSAELPQHAFRPTPKKSATRLAHNSPTRSYEFDAALRSAIEVNIKSSKALEALTAEEREKLIATFLFFEEVRAEIEQEIVSFVAEEKGVMEFEVPPYPERGALLEHMLYEQLQKELSSESYRVAAAQLKPFFDAHFQYFGELRRTLHVTLSDDNARLMIIWTADKDAGSPDAALNSRRTTTTASGTAFIPMEQLSDGEYRYLAEIFKSRFSKQANSKN